MEAKGRIWKFGNDVNTDEIIPARYLNTSDPDELAKHCMEDADPEFPNKVQKGDVIVAGSNFGCGSSREHAPWALLDFGFRAVISDRFADIFRNNSLKNGLLPVLVNSDVIEFLHAHPDHPVHIDIGTGVLSVEGFGEVEFPIDPFAAYCLGRGIDQLDFILQNEQDISTYEQQQNK
jgi:3-isopropylmalate/(R)-2-methylmalate dehydratase small subunit